MAYYTALINAWNAGTVPVGATGTPLTGLTTANKIIAVNGWGVARPQPAIITPTQLLNAIVAADFAGLGVQGLSQLQIILTSSDVDISIGNQIRAILSTLFSGKTTTLANITALAAPFDNATVPWWSVPVASGGAGLSGPISQSDATAAGLS